MIFEYQRTPSRDPDKEKPKRKSVEDKLYCYLKTRCGNIILFPTDILDDVANLAPSSGKHLAIDDRQSFDRGCRKGKLATLIIN